MGVLINIDVPDLEDAIDFYVAAFGLAVARRLGAGAVELTGWASPVYLLEKQPGTHAAGNETRTYERHWTPVHLDVVVTHLDAAVCRAVAAGARIEREVSTTVWGRIAMLADPFGHGFCLIAFTGQGYDAIASG